MTLEELITAMKAHDWLYEYSEDGAVVRGGSMERKKIVDALKKIPMPLAKQLIFEHCPEVEQDYVLLDLYRRP